jgi:phosphopantetheinyl transferase (holo-ACP synthase)
MESDLSLEAIYDQWAASFSSAKPAIEFERFKAFNYGLQDAVARVHARIKEASPADWAWILNVLDDTDALDVLEMTGRNWSPWPRIRFVSYALFSARDGISQLPPEMSFLLVRAAVHDLDVSCPKWFLNVCAEGFGADRVLNTLADFLEHGTDFEKAGVPFVMYHAFYAAYGASREAVRRALLAIPRAFLQNEDIVVRRETIGAVDSFVAKPYFDEYRELVDQVIAIGLGHPDDYVRARAHFLNGTWEGAVPRSPPRSRPYNIRAGR